MQNHNTRQSPRSDEPKNEEIAQLAYSFFEREGRLDGHDLEHWIRAEERLIKSRSSGKNPQKTIKRRIAPNNVKTFELPLKAGVAI